MKNRKDIIVTTGDLKQDYIVLGPVYFQVSNKGLFESALGSLKRQYKDEIQAMKSSGAMSADRADWGFLYGEWSVGQNDFEAAFFIAIEELKKRAAMVGADAVICMRQDIDIDTNGFAYFYLQMYGTAVRFSCNSSNHGSSQNEAYPQRTELGSMPSSVKNNASPKEIPKYRICPRCGEANSGNKMFCVVCGERLR